ncbi:MULTISPECIES: putative leader peptide [Streptomyces]|uniref:putative leader peptide n=1 Tax=Streptomyces TaxID=1883 RepID=UPI0031D9CDDB
MRSAITSGAASGCSRPVPRRSRTCRLRAPGPGRRNTGRNHQPSRHAGRLFSPFGQQWTGRRASCNASAMSRAGIALVTRRHIDLCRMSSAMCPAG